MACIVPGRKFSSTMSAVFTSSAKISLPRALAQVEAEAALAAIVDAEIDALAAHHGRVLAGFLAAEAFDLDHLGAEVGQDHAAARPGLVARQFEHPNAFETLGHGFPRPLCRFVLRRPAAGTVKAGPRSLRRSEAAQQCLA